MTAARSMMRHRALVERQQRAPRDPYAGAPTSSDAPWTAHIAALPCFLTTPRGGEIVRERGTTVAEAQVLLVPKGTDITELDRVNGVNDRQGNAIREGILRIVSVVAAHTHLEVALEASA